MKKVLSFVLSIAMVVCLMPTMAFAATTSAQADATYSDTKGTACEGAVNVLSALGVVDGFTDGTYKPEQVVTRAQMAKLIVTALGVADYASAKTSKFTDMSAATWAIPYVEYASNLNIVNGVGNNKFNPNGNVTYEQAATMIVRALGYTDKCNEMNGTWPAIYIQKATALGLFNDVTNKGATGATRGDLAIMLYNALNVKEVYADNDGATQDKKGANGDTVTMMDTLNVNGSSKYKIVTNSDADSAVNSIAGYVGAAAEVIYDKNDDVIALSDIKTTFLSGEFKSNGKFEADNGTTYTIASDAYKVFKDTKRGTVEEAPAYVPESEKDGKKIEATGGIPALTNNVITANRGKLSNASGSADIGKDFTLAVTISGKTITGIYSIASWDVKASQTKKVESNDLNQITKNKKLLNVKFALNDNQEIDTTSFILNGVSSLSDIKADNIVYVYEGDNEVTRVDVGTKVVTGKITKTTSDKVTIDGTAYKKADHSTLTVGTGDLEAGNEVTLYLDYDGKFYDADLVDGTSGNFAVVVATSKDEPETDTINGSAKIELLTADGDKTFEVNGKKFIDNNSTGVENKKITADNWRALNKKIVKYSVNDSGQITKIIEVKASTTENTTDYSVVVLNSDNSGRITKSGYLADYSIADSALIFSAPLADGNKEFDYSDDEKLSVVKKSSVLDSNTGLVSYVVDKDTNKIVLMIINDTVTSNDTYGIVTSTFKIDGGEGADFYVGSEKVTNAEINKGYEAIKDNTKGAKLFKINKTAAGTYDFEEKSAIENGTSEKAAYDVKNGYIQFVKDGVKFNFYKDAVVYIYNSTDDEYSVGSTSDLTDDDVTSIKLYKTETSDDKDEAYNLVNYIIITMK